MNEEGRRLQDTEKITIIVTPRDRFSSTEACLEHIFKNTRSPFDLIISMGGVPDSIRRRLEEKYRDRARFILRPGFVNTPELRNLALRETRTRLAACIDTDVYVLPNWLEPLLACQLDTGADMVTPLILDRDNRIHTAGNDLFITHEKGRAYATMELRYAHIKVNEDTNIKRREVDFGEVHCQLVTVETALKLGVYDDRLREGADMDSGLAWSKAGCRMMVEPSSWVYLYYPELLDSVDDVRLYMWKWDIEAVSRSYELIREKWNIEVGGRGRFKKYLVGVNNRVGVFTRLYPSSFMLSLDRVLFGFRKLLQGLLSLRWTFNAWRQGYFRANRGAP